LRIRPSPGWRAVDLRELRRYRELLYFLFWRDVKVRYKPTVIGAACAVLRPLFSRHAGHVRSFQSFRSLTHSGNEMREVCAHDLPNVQEQSA